MRGTVIRYGKSGDPVVRPDGGGKIVILTKYETLPRIGEEVVFHLRTQRRNFAYAVMDNKTINHDEDPVCIAISQIRALWNTSLATATDHSAAIDLKRSLNDIWVLYQAGNYHDAAKEARQNYEWAMSLSEDVVHGNVSPASITISRAFKSLEDYLNNAGLRT